MNTCDKTKTRETIKASAYDVIKHTMCQLYDGNCQGTEALCIIDGVVQMEEAVTGALDCKADVSVEDIFVEDIFEEDASDVE
ncbi:MAG: hypothetical protein IKB62_01555 [Oscillospiraceae bacterium]|nr:hypothetical protein [Oscillospiraceae bacterium]